MFMKVAPNLLRDKRAVYAPQAPAICRRGARKPAQQAKQDQNPQPDLLRGGQFDNMKSILAM
jgi:hypothetical protein